jgi:tetratricopeptide (TPR) repeat protein
VHWLVFHSQKWGLWQLDLPRVYLKSCSTCRAHCDGLVEMLEAGELSQRLDYFELQFKASRWQARKVWSSIEATAPEMLRRKLRRQRATCGLVDLLVEESHRQASIDCDRALWLAEAAVEMAPRLAVQTTDDDTAEGDFDHHAVDEPARAELQALAHAVYGNACRKLYRFDDAEAAFRRAHDFLLAMDEDDACRFQGAARVLSMKASLLIDTRRLDEAIDCLEEAAHATHAPRTPVTLQAEIAINRSIALGLANRHGEALAALREIRPETEEALSPRLLFALRHRVSEQLVWTGEPASARQLLPEVRSLCETGGQRLDSLRVEWLEARILAEEGHRRRALGRFQILHKGFLEQGVHHEAALLALEISATLLALGEPETAASHAREAFALFMPLRVKDEMLAALTLMAHAADRGQLTTQLLAALIRFAQGGHPPERALWL